MTKKIEKFSNEIRPTRPVKLEEEDEEKQNNNNALNLLPSKN